MTEHTTIQITKEQAEQLQERRQYSDEPYKSVIARLLGDNSATTNPMQEFDTEQFAQELAEDRQEQLEEVVGGVCGDHATEESVGEVAGRIKDLQTEINTLREELQR